MTARLFHLRLSNPELLAQLLAEKYVARGIQWLNKNAPLGWHRNLFEPQPDGTCFFRVDSRLNTSDVIALAFETRKEFMDLFGYVTHYRITKHFLLDSRTERRMGFMPGSYGWGVVQSGYRDKKPYRYEANYFINISQEILDRAWETKIRNLNAGLIPYRHLTPIELERSAHVWPSRSDPARSWVHAFFEKFFCSEVRQ
jgi:hypothetical protein